MNKPKIWTFEHLLKQDPKKTCVVCDGAVRDKVRETLPYEIYSSFEFPVEKECLIVIGGGTLMDKAKVWRAEHAAKMKLVVVPSIWGSGAEVSPITVINHEDKKEICVDQRFLPDARVIWSDLSESIPESIVQSACGDCWAHALEGFLSPLANDLLRKDIAKLIEDLLAAPIANDPGWFELSVRACSGQAMSSVGLIHGIAHKLETLLSQVAPELQWGHAKLCSLFLWPVMRFNKQASDNFEKLTAQYGLDSEQIMDVIQGFYCDVDFETVKPFLVKHWMDVLRDPCSRTNSALVRPGSLDFFAEKGFE
jgi:alcohol dehydrogenase class IV